jgi:hypothetical protein
MEVIIILFLIACVVWIIWTVQARIRASRKAALDEAWRVVLSDPNYMRRRRFEERKREDA